MPGLNLRITGRLILGFALLAALLAAAVGYTSLTLSHVNRNVERMVNVSTPVAIESTQLVANLYSTVAALRGYLLTGDQQSKIERAEATQGIDHGQVPSS
jgi:methyl-accepting chemotaxis protein